MVKLLTVADLCEQLNCKPGYVYRLVHERRITFVKLGHRQLRFPADAVEAFIAAGTVEPESEESGAKGLTIG